MKPGRTVKSCLSAGTECKHTHALKFLLTANGSFPADRFDGSLQVQAGHGLPSGELLMH